MKNIKLTKWMGLVICGVGMGLGNLLAGSEWSVINFYLIVTCTGIIMDRLDEIEEKIK